MSTTRQQRFVKPFFAFGLALLAINLGFAGYRRGHLGVDSINNTPCGLFFPSVGRCTIDSCFLIFLAGQDAGLANGQDYVEQYSSYCNSTDWIADSCHSRDEILNATQLCLTNYFHGGQSGVTARNVTSTLNVGIALSSLVVITLIVLYTLIEKPKNTAQRRTESGYGAFGDTASIPLNP